MWVSKKRRNKAPLGRLAEVDPNCLKRGPGLRLNARPNVLGTKNHLRSSEKGLASYYGVMCLRSSFDCIMHTCLLSFSVQPPSSHPPSSLPHSHTHNHTHTHTHTHNHTHTLTRTHSHSYTHSYTQDGATRKTPSKATTSSCRRSCGSGLSRLDALVQVGSTFIVWEELVGGIFQGTCTG